MTDRELLEAAARAAGIEVMRSRLDDPMRRDMLIRKSARNAHHDNGPWNPLTDDGDALRLAVKLGLHLTAGAAEAWQSGKQVAYIFEDGADAYEATRRAIVRAAAALAPSA